jgi:pyridoxal 5'-phosphate synthase pdxS subunit
MDDDRIYEVAKKYAERYVELAKMVRAEMGLPTEIKPDDVVYEEYTLEEIVEGLYGVLLEVKKLGRLPVVNFAAGGVATPADAALMMQLGADGVFVGSGIFKSSNPEGYARAIVEAVQHWDEPEVIAEVSKGLGEAMRGLEVSQLEVRMQERGV